MKHNTYHNELLTLFSFLTLCTEVRSGDTEEEIKEARKLQQDFADLKVEIINSLSGIDVVNLKVRICDFLLCRGHITQAVQEHSDALQKLTTPDGVLNFLTTRKFLGYLNYELIKLFPQVVKNDENKIFLMSTAIEKYEKKHIDFLSSNFNTLIEVFKKEDSLAPNSAIGLPELEIHLQSPWENRSMYVWKDFLDKKFLNRWPSHLMITDIKKRCIILTYTVLPHFLPAVFEDLTNHQVLENLKKQGITVDLSKLKTKVCNYSERYFNQSGT